MEIKLADTVQVDMKELSHDVSLDLLKYGNPAENLESIPRGPPRHPLRDHEWPNLPDQKNHGQFVLFVRCTSNLWKTTIFRYIFLTWVNEIQSEWMGTLGEYYPKFWHSRPRNTQSPEDDRAGRGWHHCASWRCHGSCWWAWVRDRARDRVITSGWGQSTQPIISKRFQSSWCKAHMWQLVVINIAQLAPASQSVISSWIFDVVWTLFSVNFNNNEYGSFGELVGNSSPWAIMLEV